MLDHLLDRIESNSALTFREASNYLGIPRRKLYYLIFAGFVTTRVLRDRYIFLIEDLEDLQRNIATISWPRMSIGDYEIFQDHLPYR
jgi:hypothetical protein